MAPAKEQHDEAYGDWRDGTVWEDLMILRVSTAVSTKFGFSDFLRIVGMYPETGWYSKTNLFRLVQTTARSLSLATW